jgi:dTDP-4-amino-4,6-dideoxygalactose transaminase
MGCFSFHPRKSITTGEGGMIVGSDSSDERILRSLRSHGVVVDSQAGKKPPFDLGDFDSLGYNYRLTDIQAAVGVAQMRKLERILQRRREIAAYYDRELSGLELISLPRAHRGFLHSYQSYVLFVDSGEQNRAGSPNSEQYRNQIMLDLESRGIATRPGTHAVHALSYYRERYGLNPWSCPNSYSAMTQTIALPLYPQMSQSECEFVVESVRSAHEAILQQHTPTCDNTTSSKKPRLVAPSV